MLSPAAGTCILHRGERIVSCTYLSIIKNGSREIVYYMYTGVIRPVWKPYGYRLNRHVHGTQRRTHLTASRYTVRKKKNDKNPERRTRSNGGFFRRKRLTRETAKTARSQTAGFRLSGLNTLVQLSRSRIRRNNLHFRCEFVTISLHPKEVRIIRRSAYRVFFFVFFFFSCVITKRKHTRTPTIGV